MEIAEGMILVSEVELISSVGEFKREAYVGLHLCSSSKASIKAPHKK